VKFFSLTSGKVITRDQFTILPASDQIIERMNAFADSSPFVMDDLPSDDEVPNDLSPYAPSTIDILPDHTSLPLEIELESDPAVPLRGASSVIIHPANDDAPAIGEDHSENHSENHSESFLEESNDSFPISSSTAVAEQAMHPASAEPRRQTRSTNRGDNRVVWDRNIVGTSSSSTSRRRALRVRSKVFNITVRRALVVMPDAAVKSMYAEVAQLHSKGTFQGIHPSFKHGKNVIKSFMFLKEKFTSTGAFDKLKSRLVAGGHMQDRSEFLYEDITSPTVSLSHLFIISAIAARDHRYVKTIDIGGAYLHADMSASNVYMELDGMMSAFLVQIDPTYNQFLRSDGKMVVKLMKAMYGCLESSKLWYDLLRSTLVTDGFVVNDMDPCVFNKMMGSTQITVVIYVDDLFITCRDLVALEQLQAMLKRTFHEISVHDGVIHSYLGMTFDFSIDNEVSITMAGYVNDLLQEADVHGTAASPAGDHLFTVRQIPSLSLSESKRFHTLTAKLLYLAKRSRPDILLAVSFLTTRVTTPTQDDLKKLERVIKYLNGTIDFGITLTVDSPLRVKAYVDASYGVHDDGKSHSALSLTLGSGTIDAVSGKQRIVTKSSTEAELVCASDQASRAIAGTEFLRAQGEVVAPPVVFQDNQSTISMIANGRSKSDRTRHINIRTFWMKERVDLGELEIEYVPTDEMDADILTKPLQGEKFQALRRKLLNWKF